MSQSEERRSPVLSYAIVALGVAGFAALAALQEDGPILFDAPILTGLEALRTEGLTAAVRAVTFLGGAGGMIPFTLVLAVALVVARRRRAAAFVALATGGSALLNEVLKRLFARPRPSIVERITDPYGTSFPSGHSMASSAFAVALFLVLYRELPERRRAAALVLLFPPLIGLTRNYLGVHYPTDVVAGFCLTTAWVVAVDLWYRRGHEHAESRTHAG